MKDTIDFNTSEIKDGTNELIGSMLQKHGYVVLHLDNIKETERSCMSAWENVFSETFELPDEAKGGMCRFDTYQGYTMGYRREGRREFLETRLCGSDSIEPHSPIISHKEMVIMLWELLRKISNSILSCMAHTLGVEDRYFLDLIDKNELVENELSSTLMRICSYPYDPDMRNPNPIGERCNTSLAFGAHTDVSFLTLGPFSSVSGLEIQDLSGGRWVPVEDHPTVRVDAIGHPHPRVAVFVGDIMQLMTRGYYKAAVHRVTAYDNHTTETSCANSRRSTLRNRISCPFIVRGRHRTEVPPLSSYRRFPCRSLPITNQRPSSLPLGKDVVHEQPPNAPKISLRDDVSAVCPPPPCHRQECGAPVTTGDKKSEENELPDLGDEIIVDLPDLEESTMKIIHKLLDLKRHKCTRENQSSGEGGEEPNRDWVLSAYPVQIYDCIDTDSKTA